MKSAHYQLGLLHGGEILAHFIRWLQTCAQADGIDFVLFLTPAGSAADLFLSGAEMDEFPPYAFLGEGRLWFELAAVNESRIAEDIAALDEDDFRGVAAWQALERMGVAPPAGRVMQDLGLGDELLLTDATMPQFRAFLQAYRWEVFKACREKKRVLFQRLVRSELEPGMRVAIVDASWDLSKQAAFERALRRLFPAWVAGYHFCLTPAASSAGAGKIANPDAVRSFVATDLARRDCLDFFFKNYVSNESDIGQFASGLQEFQRQAAGLGHSDDEHSDASLDELFASLWSSWDAMPPHRLE